ncbi:para-nitrobenzyl esterase [Rhodococcus tukisamuensis]|uniref:Carboxylic ester hydrolase n=1 Tax=Rhodococcus tukisamuensis TaxID=168276 RepID=A0A1G6PFW4_9NOCA|nr:carboxylesterase/lipase family protein [Rhodococcus tukisamuensis]SDC78444.1 para-nitrobenzyl esterase [Rhodococcus tukisamuensis]
MTDPLLVRTDAGDVLGREQGGLRSWRAIPYAAPPVGALRLRAPQPVTPWPEALEAFEFGSAAPQSGRFGRHDGGTDEDCLTLNVLAPSARSINPRPVMVFIHGGAYSGGSASSRLYRGERLVRNGHVVYVSLNYRLGALGYLDFGEYSTPERTFDSNLGLRDQVAALEWVQRNIAAFGGDPDAVTVFGESSGANAVTTLMCTPAARGLFARAIAQSPPAASAYGPDRSRLWAAEFLELLGGSDDPVTALTTASAETLTRAGDALAARGADEAPGTRAFAPLVDGEFLPRHPLDAFADGHQHRVPLIIGTNAREGTMFPRFLDIIPTDPVRIEKMFAETDPVLKARILAAYPGYPDRAAAVQLGGDVTFWEPSVLVAQAHAEVAPTYDYRYDFAPRLLRATGFGATHGTELLAVFDAADLPLGRGATVLGGRKGLRAVASIMQSHWLNFARHGEPRPTWPRYTAERRETLVVDTVARVEYDPDAERRRAWIGYRHRR